ncbi:hypothetical protein PG995_005057 [Apiospora arundinis]
MVHLEVLALVSLGTLVFRYQINGTIKRCCKALNRKSNAILLLHIVLSVAEVIRYYLRRYQSEYNLPGGSNISGLTKISTSDYNITYDQNGYRENISILQQKKSRLPTANLLDLILMLVQCHTSLILARDRVWAGHKSILRPVYHSQTFFRVFFTTTSFLLSSPYKSSFLPLFLLPFLQILEKIPTFDTWRDPEQLYRASVMVNASFVYPRLLVWTLCRLGGVGPLGRRYRDVYTFSIFLSAVVAMHDGGIALGPQLYIAGVGLFVVLERWVARQVLERASGDDISGGMIVGEGENKQEESPRSRYAPGIGIAKDTVTSIGVEVGDGDDLLTRWGGPLKKGLSAKNRFVDLLSWYGFIEIDTLRSEKIG